MIENIKKKLSTDTHLTDLLKGTTITFGLKLIGIAVGYLFIWLISTNFGAATLGIFTLSFTLLQIISILGRFGLDTALLRFISEDMGHHKIQRATATYFKAILFAFVLSTIFSFITYLLSPFISKYIFNTPTLTYPFKIVSFAIIPMTIINLNFETLRAMKKIKEYAFLQNVSIFLWASLILSLLTSSSLHGVDIIIIFTISIYITWLYSQYLTFKAFKFKFNFNGRNISNILKTAFPMLVAGSLMLIMGWSDTIMIGMYLDEKAVGIYTVALKIATVTSIFLMAINSMAAPKFSQFYSKNDMQGFQKIVTQSSKLIFWTSLPVSIVCIVLSEPILSLFGEEFTKGNLALILLCIGQLVNVFSGSVGYILQMTSHEKAFQIIILCSLIINIILNYSLIPVYGLTGAAFASMVSLIMWNIVSVYIIHKKIHIITPYLWLCIDRRLKK